MIQGVIMIENPSKVASTRY
uniref:Uncharacterized protein n=1 Tax=Lepeophtheirus salmonis TaxID=72036 RepID=A0A0K2UHK6_LEPSM